MTRTRSTQWDGDPWEQSEKHDTEKEIMKKNVQSSQDLRVCAYIIPDLIKSTCCNCDPGEKFMVLYHVKEIMKQDWRFSDMKVYANSKRDLYNYVQVKKFSGKGVVHETWKNIKVNQGVLGKHKGAILSIKWNRKGDYILTGSLDTTAVV